MTFAEQVHEFHGGSFLHGTLPLMIQIIQGSEVGEDFFIDLLGILRFLDSNHPQLVLGKEKKHPEF